MFRSMTSLVKLIVVRSKRLPLTSSPLQSAHSSVYSSSILLQIMEMEPERRLNLIAQHIKISTEPSVLYASHGQAIAVTLNRPKALNSLNLEMIRDLDMHLDLIKTHQVAWFQGSGGKAFCAGGDVKVLFQKDSSVEGRKVFFREEFSLDYKVAQMPTIQISCWDGIVMGGGVGISAFAPIIIATEKTLFAMPEAKLGFFTDVGINYILARLRSHLGLYLGMTGARLKGEDVFVAGIAHFYIPSSKIPEARHEIFRVFDSKEKLNNPLETVRAILQKYHAPTGKNHLENEDKIAQAFALPSASEIYLKLKSSQDDFSKKTVKLLEQQCPTSVSLIHKLVTTSKSLTLREVFVTDTIVVENMASNADFKEGVRCVLMEKGAIPKWTCDSIPKVPSQAVEQFLVPVEESVPFA